MDGLTCDCEHCSPCSPRNRTCDCKHHRIMRHILHMVDLSTPVNFAAMCSVYERVGCLKHVTQPS